MRSSQQVYINQIGFTTIQLVTITDPARRVAVRILSFPTSPSYLPWPPTHRCLGNAVYILKDDSHLFRRNSLRHITTWYQLPHLCRCPVRIGNRCHHSNPLSTCSVTLPMLHPVVHPAINPCEAPSDAPYHARPPVSCDAQPKIAAS